MNNFLLKILCLTISLNSCAQQKFDKPPSLVINKVNVSNIYKPSYYFSSAELEKNSNGLYCWKINNSCDIIDGKTTLFTYYQTTGDDNPNSIPYTSAEGEFLKGKYQGIWNYYDKKKQIFRTEKWNNGKLTFTEKIMDNNNNIGDYRFNNDKLSLEKFKNDFSLASDKLEYHTKVFNGKIIFENETTIQFINFNDGFITQHEIQIKGDPVPSGKTYFYDKNGNVERISEVENELPNGTGHFMCYSYPKNSKSGYRTKPIINCEGEIKNNFKSGEWKYYNKEGIVEKTKTYNLIDSVDVRFPNCIFNKTEPCY